MRFDYYTASIEAKADRVLDHLACSFELSDITPTTPKNGYERAYNVVRGDSVLARVQWGGNSVGTRVWASASGDRAPAFAAVVRDEFRGHNLLRADVAIDYCEPGAWDSLYALGLETADQFRLKVEHRGDYHREKDGRTLYIGSRSSAAYKRIYEKGKQTGGDPDHVRAELELKPQNAKAKQVYAYASPEQMWMATRWTQHLLKVLTGVDGMQPAPPGTIRQLTDDDRALEFMFKQYGNVLRRKLEAMGGDYEALGLLIARGIGGK